MNKFEINKVRFLLYMLTICVVSVSISIADQGELRKALEVDYDYYQKVVIKSQSGVNSRKLFLQKLLEKYEKEGLDEMYLAPLREEIKILQKEVKQQNTPSLEIQNNKDKSTEESFIIDKSIKNRNKKSEAVFKVGSDISGKHKASGIMVTDSYIIDLGDSKEEVNNSSSMSGEYIYYLDDVFGLGCGMTYQIPREQKNYKGKFNFIPVYSLIKLRFMSTKPSEFYSYFIGQFGYSLFMGDSDYKGILGLDKGQYYGIGGGIKFLDGFLIELLYSFYSGTANASGVDWGYDWYYGYYIYSYSINLDVEYSTVRLSVGYAF